jgi:hypothetical protein
MVNERELKDQTETIQMEKDLQAIKEALQRLRQLAEKLPQVDAVAIVRAGREADQSLRWQ